MIALVAYTPLAKAACEIEHWATLSQAGVQAQGQARDETPAQDQSPDDRAQCYADGAAAVMTQSKAASSEGAAAPAVDLQPLANAVYTVVPTDVPTGSAFVPHQPPPPEPVFRRVPKLLF